MRSKISQEEPNIIQNAENSTLGGMAFQPVQNAWDALTSSLLFGPLRIVMERYIWFTHALIHFQVLSQRSDDLMSLQQKETLFEHGSLILGPN